MKFDGDDVNGDGSLNSPFKTFRKAYSVVGTEGFDTIKSDSGNVGFGQETQQLLINNKVSFEGIDADGTALLLIGRLDRIEGNSTPLFLINVISNPNNVSFNNFTFELVQGSKTPDSSVFLLKNGTIKMNECHFTRSSSITYTPLSSSVIRLEGGLYIYIILLLFLL